jgi:hypothetical protein
MGQFLNGTRVRTAQRKVFRNGARLKKRQNTLSRQRKNL